MSKHFLSISFALSALAFPSSSRAASECGNNSSVPCFITGADSVAWTANGVPIHYANVREDRAGTNKYVDGTVVAGGPNDVPSYRPDGEAGRTPVYFPTSNAKGKLFIMLPGQPDKPKEYLEILLRAASRGFHAIGINYWNPEDDASYARCNTHFLNSTSPSRDSCITSEFNGQFNNIDAYTGAHRNPGADYFCYLTQFGFGPLCQGTPSGDALTTADPMRHRLRRTLRWLDVNFPNQGWSAFAGPNHDGDFDSNPPYVDWSKVVLAGHSTGSKFATYIANNNVLSRLVVLSGPHSTYEADDGSDVCTSAMQPQSNGTSTGNMYFYDSTYDGKYAKSVLCRNAMGLGNWWSADIGIVAAPYYNLHILKNGAYAPVNDCGTTTGDAGHRGTARDCALTNHGNAPVPSVDQTFAAWDYMIGP